MIDLLQLRSDELSAENGELRMQMARAVNQLPVQQPVQLPGQLPGQNVYPFSQTRGQLQNEYSPSHAALAVHQHASQAGGLSCVRPLSPNGLPQAAHVSYMDRWDWWHCPRT